MQPALENILKRRRDRTIAAILGVKEREADPHLPPDAQRQLRRVIIDQVNRFYDVVLDVAASLDNGEAVLNDDYLTKIDEIHETLVASVQFPPRPLTPTS